MKAKLAATQTVPLNTRPSDQLASVPGSASPSPSQLRSSLIACFEFGRACVCLMFSMRSRKVPPCPLANAQFSRRDLAFRQGAMAVRILGQKANHRGADCGVGDGVCPLAWVVHSIFTGLVTVLSCLTGSNIAAMRYAAGSTARMIAEGPCLRWRRSDHGWPRR